MVCRRSITSTRNTEKLVIVIIKATSIYVGSTPTFLTLQKMAKWYTRQTANLFNHFISFIKYSLLIFLWADARVVQGNGLQNRKATGSNPVLPSKMDACNSSSGGWQDLC